GQFVYGIEADIQAADISDSKTITGVFQQVGGGTSGPASLSQSQKLDWFGTVRGRLGWTPWDRTLLYATGGLIYGQEKVSQLYVTCCRYPASGSSVRTGWTVGGGIEYAFWSNITARIEGLYYDMGNETISSGPNPVTNFTRNSTFNFQGGIIRAGVGDIGRNAPRVVAGQRILAQVSVQPSERKEDEQRKSKRKAESSSNDVREPVTHGVSDARITPVT